MMKYIHATKKPSENLNGRALDDAMRSPTFYVAAVRAICGCLLSPPQRRGYAERGKATVREDDIDADVKTECVAGSVTG